MKHKALWKVSVATSREAEEAVGDLLSTIFGQLPTVYTDLQKKLTTVTVFLGEKTRWTRQARAELAAGIKKIALCGLDISPGTVKFMGVRAEDWAESWKKHFKCLAIGSVLLVRPGWLRPVLKRRQAEVVLDPGLSFGTGQHPTTAFCLRELVKHRPVGGSSRSFLDLGTGSGILAIAAAKLGYMPVRAIEYDPEAVAIARRNAHQNSVLRTMTLLQGDVTKLSVRPQSKHDVVCANLISSLLLQEQRRILAQVTETGCLVLAGILKEEFPTVQSAYEKAGCCLIAKRAQREWCSGTFRRALIPQR